MKKPIILALGLVLLLCGCAAPASPAPTQPDTTPPAIYEEAPAQPAAPEEPVPAKNGILAQEGKLFHFVEDEISTFAPGVNQIDGKTYYVEADGQTICSAHDALVQKSGALFWFESDCTLRPVTAGKNTLPDGDYWAEADGYALLLAPATVVHTGEGLVFLDDDSRVLSFPAGMFCHGETMYYADEAGDLLPPTEASPLLLDDGLYYILADGSFAQNEPVGYLTFGPDGRYTSGDEALDAGIETLLQTVRIQGMEPEAALRAVYDHLRDNYKYLSMDLQEPGTDHWAAETCKTFLDLGKGNCYCWASTLMYAARRLGYQAYVVAAWESNPSNDHAWAMIDWPDGESYLFDPQLEYAFRYMYSDRPEVDMFKVPGRLADESQKLWYYNDLAYYFP